MSAALARQGVAQRPCPGRASLARPHQLWTLGSITWCCRCGRYSHKRVRGLQFSCRPGRYASVQLKRLRAGLHPVTGVSMSRCTKALRTRLRWKQSAAMSELHCGCVTYICRQQDGYDSVRGWLAARASVWRCFLELLMLAFCFVYLVCLGCIALQALFSSMGIWLVIASRAKVKGSYHSL